MLPAAWTKQEDVVPPLFGEKYHAERELRLTHVLPRIQMFKLLRHGRPEFSTGMEYHSKEHVEV